MTPQVPDRTVLSAAVLEAVLHPFRRLSAEEPAGVARTLCVIGLAFVSCATPPATDASLTKRPNFILILADDMGDAGLSCTGNPHFETPHLDRLAREGMRFTDFHSSGAVCSPTRAGLLTGRYQQRTGVDAVVNADPEHPDHGDALQHSELTFAEALSAHGYATAIFGKWHVGYSPEFSPVHQGFDEFRGFVSGNVDYHSHHDRMGTADWWNGDRLENESGYATHLITRHALRFIREHADEPFCLYLPHQAIHNPNQGPDDPPVRGPRKQPARELAPVDEAVRAMTLALDDGVGELLAELEHLDIDERTLVVFLSDNGGTRQNRTTGAGLRGFKGSLWEGGHRVPALFRWPGKIPEGSASATPGITLDLMPTMLALAGSKLPDGHDLDGVDLSSTLLEGGALPARALFWEHGPWTAMREGPWKLVRKGDAAPSLFDLRTDPGERDDLAASHADRVSRMASALESWRIDVRSGATPQDRDSPP